jgi:hypothetical protein
MKYLVLTQSPGDPAEQPLIEAIAFSHAVRCRWGNPHLPQTDRDAPYMFPIRKNDNTTTVAVAVPDNMLGLLTEDEEAGLTDTLPAELQPPAPEPDPMEEYL